MARAARVPALQDVPLGALAVQGVAAVLLDLDNTLCDPHGERLSPQAVAFCEELRSLGMQGYIISNGHHRRAQQLASQAGLPCLSRARKPMPFAYRRALRELGLPPRAVAAVGDQFLTDALGALFMGIRLYLVEPRFLRDKPLVRLARPVDRVLRLLVPELSVRD